MRIIIELDCSLNSWEIDDIIAYWEAEPYVKQVTKDCSACKRPIAYCALSPTEKTKSHE